MANIDESITIAVDAMGGDHAPSEIVTGAVEAAKRHNVNIFLVGDPDQHMVSGGGNDFRKLVQGAER